MSSFGPIGQLPLAPPLPSVAFFRLCLKGGSYSVYERDCRPFFSLWNQRQCQLVSCSNKSAELHPRSAISPEYLKSCLETSLLYEETCWFVYFNCIVIQMSWRNWRDVLIFVWFAPSIDVTFMFMVAQTAPKCAVLLAPFFNQKSKQSVLCSIKKLCFWLFLA